MITFGLLGFVLFARERVEYEEYVGRNESTSKYRFSNEEKHPNHRSYQSDEYPHLILDKERPDIVCHRVQKIDPSD